MTSDDQSDKSAVRTSISFTEEQYEAIQRTAKKKKVSVAWVVRDAVEQYFDSEAPLFASSKKKDN